MPAKPLFLSLRARACAALFFSCGAFSLHAQVQPPAPPPPAAPQITGQEAEEEAEVVELDPFTVSADRDVGYTAVDTLAGGRTNTPVRLTPAAMSSLTRNFIDDVGLQNVREALRWSVNVVPSDWTAGKRFPFGSFDYNFRGAGQSLHGGSGPTRNYFTFYQAADTYNVDRIEFDRGPNSILFGVGTVGGVLSIYTKLPRFDRTFFSPTVVVDSEGSFRFEGDINYLVNDRLALRLNVLEDHPRGWREDDEDERRAADLAVMYKLTDRTNLRLEVEKSKAKVRIMPDNYGESLSRWDGTTTSPTWGAPPANEDATDPIHPWGEERFNVWIAGQPDLGMQDWVQGFRTSGTFLRVAPYPGFYPETITNGTDTINTADMPVLPQRDFTLSPSDSLSRPQYENATVWLNHSFNDNLDISLSGFGYWDKNVAQNYEAVTSYQIDINEQLPNGQPNPNFGQIYGDFFLSRQKQERTVAEGRVQVNYHFESEAFGHPWRQLFSISAGDQTIRWKARQYNAQVVPPEGVPNENWAENMVWGRVYANDPNARIQLPDEINGMTVQYAPMPFDWFDFDETFDLQNVAAFSQTRLFDDRLSILLGARRDFYDHRRVGANTGDVVEDDAEGTTYSAGAIYYFGSIGVFANYSENFDPIGPGKSPGLDGRPFEAATGSGFDYGLRFSTGDGRYYATLGRYDTESEGRITNTKIGFGGTDGIWARYYAASGVEPDPENINLTYDDTESLEVKGYEFEITANPTPSLRIQASFGLPESEIVTALPGQRAYFAENLPLWQEAAAGDTPEAAALAEALTNAQNTFAANETGKDRVGLVDYTASLFAMYTITSDSRWQGFSFGGGVSQIGEQYVGEVAGEPVFSSKRLTSQLVLGYRTRLWENPLRLALNIENVHGDEDAIITSYDGTWRDLEGNPVPSGFYLPQPRTFKLTASMTF